MRTHGENIEGNGSVRCGILMNEPADFFARFRCEYRFSTPVANLGGDIFDENPSPLNIEHLAHEFIPAGFVSTDLAFEHRAISVS